MAQSSPSGFGAPNTAAPLSKRMSLCDNCSIPNHHMGVETSINQIHQLKCLPGCLPRHHQDFAFATLALAFCQRETILFHVTHFHQWLQYPSNTCRACNLPTLPFHLPPSTLPLPVLPFIPYLLPSSPSATHTPICPVRLPICIAWGFELDCRASRNVLISECQFPTHRLRVKPCHEFPPRFPASASCGVLYNVLRFSSRSSASAT